MRDGWAVLSELLKHTLDLLSSPYSPSSPNYAALSKFFEAASPYDKVRSNAMNLSHRGTVSPVSAAAMQEKVFNSDRGEQWWRQWRLSKECGLIQDCMAAAHRAARASSICTTYCHVMMQVRFLIITLLCR